MMFFNFEPQRIVVELVNGPDDGLSFIIDIDDTKLVKYSRDDDGNITEVLSVYRIERRDDGKYVGVYVDKSDEEEYKLKESDHA